MRKVPTLNQLTTAYDQLNANIPAFAKDLKKKFPDRCVKVIDDNSSFEQMFHGIQELSLDYHSNITGNHTKRHERLLLIIDCSKLSSKQLSGIGSNSVMNALESGKAITDETIQADHVDILFINSINSWK